MKMMMSQFTASQSTCDAFWNGFNGWKESHIIRLRSQIRFPNVFLLDLNDHRFSAANEIEPSQYSQIFRDQIDDSI